MVGTYDVMLGQEPIGTVEVTKEGLYYRFDCRCRLTGQVLYELIARWGDRRESLGICVPRDGRFGLDTKLPVKRFGTEAPVFSVTPRHEPLTRDTGKFIPIRPEEPFAYLAMLEKAHLETRNGEVGIVLPQ